MKNFQKTLATAMALSIIASQVSITTQALTFSPEEEPTSFTQEVLSTSQSSTYESSSTFTGTSEHSLILNVDGSQAGTYALDSTGETTVNAYVDFAYSNIASITVYRQGDSWTWENVTGANGSEQGYTFDNDTEEDKTDDAFVSVSFGGGAGGADQESLNNLMCYITNPQANIIVSIQTPGFSTAHNTLSISNDSNMTLQNSSSEHQVANRAEFDYRWLVKSGYEVDQIKVSYGNTSAMVDVGGSTLVLDSGTKISANYDGNSNYLTVSITDMLEDLQIHADAHRTEVDLAASGSNSSSTNATIKWQGTGSILITPDSGYTITGLTANGNPLVIGGTSTIAGVIIETVRNADGTITVKGTSEGDFDFSDINISVTAAKDMHYVNVFTNTTVTSSIDAASLHSGDALELTLTPDSGYEVSYISVTYNGATGTIPVTGGYGIVGGRTFNTSITTGDVVKVTMQGIDSDVIINATSVMKDVDVHTISVITDGNMTSSGASVSVKEGETYDLILTPNSGYSLDTVSITYKNMNRNLTLNGTTQVIDGLAFTAQLRADNTVLVSVPAISDNLLVNAKAVTTSGSGESGDSNDSNDSDKETHTMIINTDNNVSSSKTSTTVNDGASEYFTLYPSSGYAVKNISISYNGQSGTLDPNGASITLSDCLFVSTAQSNGNVLVSAYGIENNVSFSATSIEDSSQKHQVTVTSDYNLSSSIESSFVTSGSAQNVTLTPTTGYSVDAVKVTYDGKTGTLTSGASSLTLSGVTFSLNVASSGLGTVSMSAVNGDVVLEASSIYGSSDVSYLLQVTTDSRISSNITTEEVQEIATRIVTFTPDYKFSVASISLTYNDESADLTLDGEAYRVGGKMFIATRLADGVIQVEIPSMEGDVSMSAKSGTGQYLIEVDSGDFTDCVYDGEQFLGLYEKMTVTFEPSAVAVMEGLKVTTSRGSATANFSDEKISVDGYYYNIGIDADGNGYIIIDSTDRDLKIEPIIYQTAYLATVISETGVSFDKESKEAVEFGDEYTITFTPDTGYYIDNIELKYGDNTYEIDIVGKDDYIYLEGEKNPITISDNGVVTLQILEVNENMTFTLEAYKYDGYTISKSQDFYTSISYTGTAPFDEDDTTTITVTPVDGYVVSRVTLSDSTDKVTFYTDDESVLFNGTRYQIRWNNDGSCSFTMNGISSNLTVSSNGTLYTSDQSVVARHDAYLAGYGNGMFGINSSMTRAEAVTMLTTIFFPNYDFTTTSGNQHFIDVVGNVWYSNPVNFAASQGLLQSIIRTNGSFNPDLAITRAELVVLMCEYSKMSTPFELHDKVFNDMSVTHWAYQYIHTAEQNGWVAGYPDDTFRPENEITRAEVTVMINRVLGRRADPNATFVTQFTDVSPSHWAYLDIMEATNDHNVLYFDGDGEVWA